MLRFFYFTVYLFGLGIGALTSTKIRRFWKQRLKKAAHSKMTGQPSSPLIWLHCSSGEFEYAKPVLKALKEKSYSTFVTYFSPTYSRQVLTSPHVDFAEPLPLDLPGPLQTVLSTYKPQELWISRTDLWPEVLYQCRKAKIPVILFSASRSKKTGWRAMLAKGSRFLYNRLEKIYVVSEADKAEFERLGVKPEVTVLGDTRYDQVQIRLHQAQDLPLLRLSDLSGPPVFVAGSTWSEDENALLAACSELLSTGDLRLILAPHEPHPSHLETLKRRLNALNLESQVWSEVDQWTAPVLIVDKIGILAEIYSYGDMAFVGGSFKAKVHSVMEPLAAGCPTLVGPKHQNNREALEFSSKLIPGYDDMAMVTACHTSEALKQCLEKLLSLPDRDLIKATIKAEVASKTGATQSLLKARIQS